MKRSITIIISLFMMFSLCACGAKTIRDPNNAVEGKDFTYTRSDFDDLVTQYELPAGGYSHSEAVKILLDMIIIKKSLYNMALSMGYSVSDEEIWEAIDRNREAVDTAINASDFYDWLESSGMTEEEYRNVQFEIFKSETIITNYLTAEAKVFLDRTPLTEDFGKQWSSHVYKIIQQAVNEQNIRIASDLEWSLSYDDSNTVKNLCSWKIRYNTVMS